MMYRSYRTQLISIFLLTGCGGEPFYFSGAAEPAIDGGAYVGDTGAAAGGSNGSSFDSGAPGGTAGTSTGGASSGGAAMGGSPSTGGENGSGGAPLGGSGGESSTGGVVGDACALVTHDNGLGQTWQDCVPIGTYTQSQAMKACAASGAGMCIATGKVCTVFEYEKILGYTADGSQLLGMWGFAGSISGYAAPAVHGGICDVPTSHPDWRWR